MPILNRVSRLLTADLHAVLDRLEEPQAQLQQALREMHELVGEMQQDQQHKASQLAALAEQQRQLASQHEATQAELELCLNANQESLTRTVMRRRLVIERSQAAVSRQLHEGQQQLDKLNKILTSHQQELQELTHQADLASQVAATEAAPSLSTYSQQVTEADIDLALLAEQNNRRPA